MLRGFPSGGVIKRMPKQTSMPNEHSVPVIEALLRAEVEAGNVDASIGFFEKLVRRHRTPHAQVCTGLLQLCVTHAPRQALWMLEQMSYERGLEVDDYTRIVRLYIMQRVETERLVKFQEIGCEILTFSDEGMHEYFTHFSSLLNFELHEAVCSNSMATQDALDVSLVTHKRQVDAIAALSKRGTMMTPLFAIIMAGMGGREGAQSPREVRELSCVGAGLASAPALEQARAQLETLGLNESQAAAAGAALTQRLTLIQGPPGTGKTRVATEIVKLWVGMGLGPVLVCADSNVAVDNIGALLAAAGVNIVRCGRPEAVADALKPYLADKLGGPPAVAAADVVLCTCTAAGGNLFAKAKFPLVLMDEVAQATEPSVLVPLVHGCRQLVLLGDHKQLRPTVVSDRASEGGLKFSLFERLIKCGVPPTMLATQYRMHASLCAFASAEFYGGRLSTGVAAEARPQLRGFRWPRPDVSIALVPSRSMEDGGASSSSKRNAGEAQQLCDILRDVLAAGELQPADVGVVTPYKAQVATIRQLLGDRLKHLGGRAVEVGSVDGFQGREKELILFSAVRANRGGSLGFVSDARRLNVLLTRARRGMVVVADPPTLVHSRRWANWLAWVDRAGACAAPGWRPPPRPPRYRDASSDESDEDTLGRRIARRRGDDSDSDGDPQDAAGSRGMQMQAKSRAAARKEQRRAERKAKGEARAAGRRAEGGGDDGDGGEGGGGDGGDGGASSSGKLAEEQAWRELLLQQAANADSDYQQAYVAQVEKEARAAAARARGELTEDEQAAAAAEAERRRAEEEESAAVGTVPFAFVALPPTQYSPAEDAGLLAGDAILRFGAAYKLEHVPAQIRSGQTVAIAVVEAGGRKLEKHVVPRVYDQRNPRSLLGCQIVDACPLEFVPHPALQALEAKKGKLQQKRRRTDGGADANEGAAAAPPAAAALVPPAACSSSAADGSGGGGGGSGKRRAVGEVGAASRGSGALPGNVAVELPGGEQLLPNWRPAKDAQGRLYFYCLLTGETSWHKPRLLPSLSLPGA